MADSKARDVRAMFTRIAGRYDLMNSLMTLGMHGRWRRLAAASARPTGALALDAGAGTGDLSLELARAGARRVIAADFSDAMLIQAKHKLVSASSSPTVLGRIEPVAGDAMRLQFPDETFA